MTNVRFVPHTRTTKDEKWKAIGGEMEGAGLASAADRKARRCEWIVAKAICDWADGKKSNEHQAFAAASAVSLVEHVFNQAGALDDLSKWNLTDA